MGLVLKSVPDNSLSVESKLNGHALEQWKLIAHSLGHMLCCVIAVIAVSLCVCVGVFHHYWCCQLCGAEMLGARSVIVIQSDAFTDPSHLIPSIACV